jgi:hypothetical protein
MYIILYCLQPNLVLNLYTVHALNIDLIFQFYNHAVIIIINTALKKNNTAITG